MPFILADFNTSLILARGQSMDDLYELPPDGKVCEIHDESRRVTHKSAFEWLYLRNSRCDVVLGHRTKINLHNSIIGITLYAPLPKIPVVSIKPISVASVKIYTPAEYWIVGSEFRTFLLRSHVGPVDLCRDSHFRIRGVVTWILNVGLGRAKICAVVKYNFGCPFTVIIPPRGNMFVEDVFYRKQLRHFLNRSDYDMRSRRIYTYREPGYHRIRHQFSNAKLYH